eukprot:GHUV01001445.1.p1 GENE.GHUV01001445.1~~GHUV01001445.1.p1  ORF type:complete len:408 (+),score=98.79 GHUV01001445.1:200-1423(+)
MRSLGSIAQQNTALGNNKGHLRVKTTQPVIHAGARTACAVHSSSRHGQCRSAAASAVLDRISPQRSLCGPVSRPISRSVICCYRPDKADELPASASEAAAFSELSADAAAQAAAEHLTSTSSDVSSTASSDDSNDSGPSDRSTAQGGNIHPGKGNIPHRSAVQDPTQSSHDHHDQHQQHSSSSSKRPTTSTQDGSTPSQKLQARLDDMTSQYEALDGRLDSLEHTLVSLLSNVKDRARRPAAAAGVGPAAGASDGSGAAIANEAKEGDGPDYDMEDDDEHGGGLFSLKKLQTSLSENINQGYLESVKHLRDMLMAYEWHLHGKELAERKGVAAFEKHCAMHDIDVNFDVLTKLYNNPNDLNVLSTNKLKILARSIIQHAVDERYCSIYWECTQMAKELAKTGLKVQC